MGLSGHWGGTGSRRLPVVLACELGASANRRESRTEVDEADGGDPSRALYPLPVTGRADKRETQALLAVPSSLRGRHTSAMSGLAAGEPFPLHIPSCNPSSGG